MNSFKNKILINRNSIKFAAENVIAKAKIIILFFSASWCPNCNKLLPILIEIYEEGKRRKIRMEIINISSDIDKRSMIDGFKMHGNWFSLPFGDELAEELRWTYNITYLPSIIVLTPSGEIISKHGYKEILAYGINVLITWT